jgi:hypothetical protein
MPDLVDRPKFESRLADELTAIFGNVLAEIQSLLSGFNTKLGDLKKLPPDLFNRLQANIITIIRDVLIEAYVAAFTSMDGFLADSSARTSRRGALFVKDNAEQWADFYAPKLAKDITTVSQARLREIADRSPALPIRGLGIRDMIAPIFSFGRAMMIARTEVTNVIPIAEQQAIGTFQEDVEIVPFWFTKLDERVCPICEPRHMRPRGVNWEAPPPAHPRCRCEVIYLITYDDGRTVEVNALEEVITLGKPRVSLRNR